jgi:hypothetical protein
MSEIKAPKKNNETSFWMTMPGLLTGGAILMTVIAVLTGVFSSAGLFKGNSPTPAFIPPTVDPQTLQSSSNPADLIPTPDPSIINGLPVPPTDSGCPYDTRAGWLQNKDTWYGPWDGYYIRYDAINFYVYDPKQWNAALGTNGLQTAYSTQIAQNSWTEFMGSPFQICINSVGNVYALYSVQ